MKNLFARLFPFAVYLCAFSAPAEVTMNDIWRWGLLRKAETNGWELGSHAGFVTGSATNFYEKQRGTILQPGYLGLYYNLNEMVYFDYGGVGLSRGYQTPSELAFPWPLASGRLVTEESYPYPVFRLELGENWTDFEIKASTNNYEPSGSPSGSNLVYYYRSWTADQHPVNPDTNAWAYFTDDCAADARVWRLKGSGSPISAKLSSTGSVVSAVYFYPSRGCECGWMRKGNTNLVWSWLRVDDLGYEKNFDGTQTRWRAIRPDSWETGRTVP